MTRGSPTRERVALYRTLAAAAARDGTFVSAADAYATAADDLEAALAAADREREAAQQVREVCICAAIVTAEGKVIRGHRHDDCIKTAIKMGLKPRLGEGWQGFVTSKNRYVDRREGMALQRAAGIESAHGYRGDLLFSEDLY